MPRLVASIALTVSCLLSVLVTGCGGGGARHKPKGEVVQRAEAAPAAVADHGDAGVVRRDVAAAPARVEGAAPATADGAAWGGDAQAPGLSSATAAVDAAGIRSASRVVRAGGNYPLLRIDERWRSPVGGPETLIGRQVMVA